MKKILYISFFLTVLFSISPILILAQNSSDVGFIKGSVWASNDNPVAGEEIVLYTVLYNGSDGVLRGRVQFFDGDMLLGERDVSIDKMRVSDISIKWITTPGLHTFSTKLINGVITEDLKEPYNINLSPSEGGEKYTISVKQKTVPIKAQVSDEGQEGDLHLKKIDSLEKSLDKFIPDSVSDSASEYTKGIEEFREKQNESFKEKRDAINKDMNISALQNSEFKDIIKPTKDTTVDELIHPGKKIGLALKTPIGYVKLFFLGVLIFVFSNPFIFYVAAVVLIVFIVRMIIRKVRRS